MALLTGSWLLDTLLLTATLLYLFYLYLVSAASYFKNRGIPYLEPNLLFGHLDVFKLSFTELSRSLYNSFPGERFFGYYQAREPMLILKDLDLVQRIMVKDFSYFTDRGFRSVKSDLMTKNMFFLKGQRWRSVRSKLIPTFTTGKLKLMFDQFDKSGEHLLEEMGNLSSAEPVNTKTASVNFGIEVIASTAVGLDFSKNNPQSVQFIERINTVFATGFRQVISGIALMFAPRLMSILGLSIFSPGVNEYFINLIKATKEFRIKNNIKRDDYFQLVMAMQESEKSGKTIIPVETDSNENDALVNQMEYVPHSKAMKTEDIVLTDEDIAAQTLGFILGGTDSVSDTVGFALYHISKDQKIYARVTEEVFTSLAKNGGWTYHAVKEMTYIDQIIQETLRVYSTFPINYRKCTTPYQIPDSKVVVEKGMIVAIPVAGIHMDPNFYPSPEVFDPDRFADNNYKPSPKFMPFGDGPRICIGMRFAIMEMKVFLAKILSKYSIEVSDKTQEPFVFDKTAFPARRVGGVWISLKELKCPFEDINNKVSTEM